MLPFLQLCIHSITYFYQYGLMNTSFILWDRIHYHYLFCSIDYPRFVQWKLLFFIFYFIFKPGSCFKLAFFFFCISDTPKPGFSNI